MLMFYLLPVESVYLQTLKVKSIDRVSEIYHPWKELSAIRLVKVLKLRIWT